MTGDVFDALGITPREPKINGLHATPAWAVLVDTRPGPPVVLDGLQVPDEVWFAMQRPDLFQLEPLQFDTRTEGEYLIVGVTWPIRFIGDREP